MRGQSRIACRASSVKSRGKLVTNRSRGRCGHGFVDLVEQVGEGRRAAVAVLEVRSG